MKRGFLLRAEERKSAAKRRVAQKQKQSDPPPATAPAQQGSEVDMKRLSRKLAYGHLTDEQKALPSDYDASQYKLQYKENDARNTNFDDDDTTITTVPQPIPKGEIGCEWVVHGRTKAKVLNAPGYPAPIPKPHRPDLYEVRSTPDMGVGLFVKHNVKRGDLILAERPLLVAPRGIRPLSTGTFPDHHTPRQIQQIIMFEFEQLLEVAISRLPPESRADFKSLHNAHTEDGSGPLLGIIRSNGYAIDKLYDGTDKAAVYGAICKIGSRINHSCIPNVKYHFKLDSFSMQFYAVRDIKAGEQLFYSYCSTTSSTSERKTELEPYGFVCKCPACVNTAPEGDKLRSSFAVRIFLFKTLVENPSATLNLSAVEEAVKLEKEMIKEGLDAEVLFLTLLMAIYLAYDKLGKLVESERYGVLVESFQKIFEE